MLKQDEAWKAYPLNISRDRITCSRRAGVRAESSTRSRRATRTSTQLARCCWRHSASTSRATGAPAFRSLTGIFTNGVGLGTLNDAGKIGIPDSTWKIALVLPSGAGHDGVPMATLTDIGMLFVRCKGGVSHNPAEAVTAADVAVAIDVTGRFLELVAKQP